MRRPSPLAMVLLFLVLAGCSKENLQRGMYEGLRTRDGLQRAPSERLGKPEAPDYSQYEQARKEKRP